MKEDIKSSNPGRNNKALNNNYVEDIFKNEFVQCRNEINKNYTNYLNEQDNIKKRKIEKNKTGKQKK